MMEIKKVEPIQGEERGGFYVQPMMKRAWLAQLEILKEIDALCRRHHIRYFAQWGTLLGAVSDHGFIPWDDDMDFAMLRKDYERFQYYAENELPMGWRILKVNPTLIRVVNSVEICLEQEFLDKYHGCPYIMGVDFFAMDDLPSDKTEQEILANLFEAVSNLHRHWDTFEEDCKKQGVTGENKWERLKEIEELTGYHFDQKIPVREQLYNLGDHIAAMYWDMGYEEVTFVPRLYDQPDYHIPKSCFDRIIEIPFENTTIPVLEDYDLLLRLKFGDDYMTPLQVKANHDYPFFRDQIKILRNYFERHGKALPEFFDMDLEQEDE